MVTGGWITFESDASSILLAFNEKPIILSSRVYYLIHFIILPSWKNVRLANFSAEFRETVI